MKPEYTHVAISQSKAIWLKNQAQFFMTYLNIVRTSSNISEKQVNSVHFLQIVEQCFGVKLRLCAWFGLLNPEHRLTVSTSISIWKFCCPGIMSRCQGFWIIGIWINDVSLQLWSHITNTMELFLMPLISKVLFKYEFINWGNEVSLYNIQILHICSVSMACIFTNWNSTGCDLGRTQGSQKICNSQVPLESATMQHKVVLRRLSQCGNSRTRSLNHLYQHALTSRTVTIMQTLNVFACNM